MTREVIDEIVLPALLQVLQGERSDDMISAALVAVARIGAGDSGRHRAGILAGIRMHLSAPSQELSETAVLALGIYGDDGGLAMLMDVLGATKKGAALLGRGSVPTRTRAFAAFALGAMADDVGAADAAAVETQQRIALALLHCLEGRNTRPDVPTAAVLALGLSKLPERLQLPPKELLRLPFVESVMSREALVRELLVRARATIQRGANASIQERSFRYVAIARLAAASGAKLRGEVLEHLIKYVDLAKSQSIERSAAVVALGEIANAGTGKQDRRAVKALMDAVRSGQPIERRFASIALAKVTSRPGSDDDPLRSARDGRSSLEKMLARGGASERPWGALALGVQGYGLAKARHASSTVASSAVAESLRRNGNAANIEAYGLGLALMYAAPEVSQPSQGHRRTTLAAFQRTKDPDARGHLALSLGMLGVQEARSDLRAALSNAKFQPMLLWSAAVGLGLLQDDEITPVLVEYLKTARAHSSRAAIAAALGAVGDARAARPLVDLALDSARPDGTRAFAVVGLGILCEERTLPWRNPKVLAAPYAARTSTLKGDSLGLLDLF
ncbi:MAG: HEAT repeat domain-containing protein [Planctomycetota bacterium]